MNTYKPEIDAYIDKSPEFARPILNHLRELVHKTCPEVVEAIKWGFPNFMYGGAILCNIAAFKEHCSFGFWKAALMSDNDNLLSVSDKIGMGHLGKIQTLKDLPKDSVLKKYIKEAMTLNEAGIKMPAKPKSTAPKELDIPDYFTNELKKNKAAKTHFDTFSFSAKKEYVEWLTEAKTDTTRDKRLTTAIEWIAEGKTRHWKYKNC